MRKRPIATALAATLFASTLALAGPRPKKAPPAQPLLTPWEQVCQAAGVFASDVAGKRDEGFSRLDVLQYQRRWDQDKGAEDWIRRAHEDIIAVVFQYPRLPARALRAGAVESCLQTGPQAMMAPTSQGAWR